ncbi:MAG: hypothetical protein JWN98_485 [Abditibacteriota bacterium]|nr:hypothetical protein [Abditibacteriota bacterium]
MNVSASQAPPSGQGPPRFGPFDLRKWLDATLAVLVLRLAMGLLALPISARFPDTPLEQQVSVWPSSLPPGVWLQRVCVMPWMRYDWEYYVHIVTRGYRLDDGTASFHPLYPLLARPLAWMTGSAPVALLLISTLSTIVLCVMFARYVERFHAPRLATPAAWLLLLAPPSFIFLAPYTESTFLALCVACLSATRLEKWWLAGLLGALATLTRQQGVAMLMPLGWQLVVAIRAGRAMAFHGAALSFIPAGYALYSYYRLIILGEWPSAANGLLKYWSGFLVSPSSQIVVPGSGLAAPWRPVFETAHGILNAPNPYHLVIDFVLGWAFVLLLVFGWKRLHATERLYSAAITFLALCFYSPIYMSLPRHMLLAFPAVIVLASWAMSDKTMSDKAIGNRARYLIEACAIANLLLLAAFVRHGWVP